VQLTEL
jgi:hypothetical protein